MRSPIEIARGALVVAVIGLGAVTAAGPTVAFAEPPPGGDGRDINITPNFPRGGFPDAEGGGGGGYTPEVPAFKPPESIVTGQTVVVRRPEIPDVPPPVVIPVTPVYEPEPEPVNVPVIVEPAVPAAVPVAVPVPPVQLPVLPPPPAAPQLPVPESPQVLLTSSAEPGTQALTVILMFTMVGAWIYGHRIASHWSLGRKSRVPTTT